LPIAGYCAKVTIIAMRRSHGQAVDEDVLLHPERWNVILPTTPECGARSAMPGGQRRRWSREHAHRGPQRELLLCIKGRAFFGLHGRVHPAYPGTLFVIEPDVDHDNYYPASADALEHLWIRSLGPQVFASWYRIAQGRLHPLHKQLSVIPQYELGVLAESLSRPDPGPPDMQAARLRLLVGLVTLHLARHRTEAVPDEPRPFDRVQSRVVDAICAHIDATAGKGVTLDFLSEFSGYSKFHLLRMFRKKTGSTVHHYVDRVREECFQRLRAEGQTNRAMAEALGFSSSPSFLRWRRQHRF
jgi:AraC-like DNA-binding protein